MAAKSKHYKKDGTVYTGKTHKMSSGVVHSGVQHRPSSIRLYHYTDLSKKAKEKARKSWR